MHLLQTSSQICTKISVRSQSKNHITIVRPKIFLIEVLKITNQGYWLQMINIELSGALTLIKHQMNIFQVSNQEFVFFFFFWKKYVSLKGKKRSSH